MKNDSGTWPLVKLYSLHRLLS